MVGPGPAWPTVVMTTTLAHPSGSQALSAATLAEATPTDRNRAVDFYRAAAMGLVAVGHWLGMVVVIDHGKLTGGNLLDFCPGYAWFTWIGQVMPLFFFVGGFASATSLRSAERKGVRPSDWVATRLRRMTTPAAALAGFWLLALGLGAAVGGFGIVALGAAGGALPPLVLPHHTIDTPPPPVPVRLFPTHPRRVGGGVRPPLPPPP